MIFGAMSPVALGQPPALDDRAPKSQVTARFRGRTDPEANCDSAQLRQRPFKTAGRMWIKRLHPLVRNQSAHDLDAAVDDAKQRESSEQVTGQLTDGRVKPSASDKEEVGSSSLPRPTPLDQAKHSSLAILLLDHDTSCDTNPRWRFSGARQEGRPTHPRAIDQLPSGAYRVRVYAGADPLTGKRHDLIEVMPAGPKAQSEAEKVRTRLAAPPM
jgi:hypothetical protein